MVKHRNSCLVLGEEENLLKPLHHIRITHKFYIAELFRSLPAFFGKAGLGEEKIVLPAVGEQVAPHDQRFEHAQINGFVCPFAFGESFLHSTHS